MPKTLILSCNTGQGHNAAGLAVEEALNARGMSCRMEDTLLLCGKRTSRVVSDTYVGIVNRAPRLFFTIYKAGSLVSSSRRKSPVYFANTRYAGRLLQEIEDGGYDRIVTPHLFPAEALTYLRRKGLLRVPFYVVATDYTCIPFWEETRPDAFFVPHPDLVPSFAQKGIDMDLLIPTGIPVSARFEKKLPREEARDMLGLPLSYRMLLVMTGSMGFGQTLSLVDALSQRAPSDAMIVAMTGHNDALYVELAQKYPDGRRVSPVRFTDRVPAYMDACDVLLTKPGGLSSTEAAVKRVPMVHTPPIPGCETENARFFSDRGMSVMTSTVPQAADAALRLLADPARRAEMLRCQERAMPKNAAGRIADIVSRAV